MAYVRSNTDAFIDGFSLSPLPYPVLLILAVLSIFLVIKSYLSFDNTVEDVEDGFNWVLFLTPVVILLIAKGLSSMDPDWLYYRSPWGGRRRTYYEPSEGSSPWGVLVVILVLLVLLQYRSSVRESWLI